jgi:hypothetical protein
MRRTLQFLALAVVLRSAVTWAVTGANRAWTKTEVQIKTLDPVTGIEGISYDKKFQPGVDFLGAAFGGALLLAGASLFFRKTKQQPTQNQ